MENFNIKSSNIYPDKKLISGPRHFRKMLEKSLPLGESDNEVIIDELEDLIYQIEITLAEARVKGLGNEDKDVYDNEKVLSELKDLLLKYKSQKN